MQGCVRGGSGVCVCDERCRGVCVCVCVAAMLTVLPMAAMLTVLSMSAKGCFALHPAILTAACRGGTLHPGRGLSLSVRAREWLI